MVAFGFANAFVQQWRFVFILQKLELSYGIKKFKIIYGK